MTMIDLEDQRGRKLRRISDFEVSWVGAGSSNHQFCFGSEDGRFALTGPATTNIAFSSPVLSSESVNGIAFYKDVVAISTRNEITFLPPPFSTAHSKKSVIPVGSHGVISTSSGLFISPSGPSGLLLVNPIPGTSSVATFFNRGEGEPFNFYQVASLPLQNRDVIVCSTRQGGLVGIDLASGSTTRKIYSHEQTELDVVDTCALGEGLSAVAVSRDGTIIFKKDVLTSEPPLTIKFPSIDGVAYRLMSSRGHLFLLTSKALYVMLDLAKRFLNGQDVRRESTVFVGWPIEAVDANIVDDRWLLIVLPQAVWQIDLDHSDLLTGANERVYDQRFVKPIPSNLKWDSRMSYSEETELSPVLA